VRARYGVTVVCVKAAGRGFTHATPDTVLGDGDVVVVAEPPDRVERFAAPSWTDRDRDCGRRATNLVVGAPGSLVGTSTSERRPDAAPPTAAGDPAVNALGLGLLLVAGLLVLIEVAAPGIGLAGALAAAASVIGLALLMGDGPGPDVSAALALPTLVAALAAATVVARRLARGHGEPSLTSGAGAVLGRETTVRATPGHPAQGFVAGAWWALRGTDGPLADGDPVLVVGLDGLVLEVEHLPPPAGPPPALPPDPEQKDP
jgi:membrane protein implicated in regulation of membrane protease activity